MSSGKADAEKARYWQRTIREAARSGRSIREFCRRRRLRERQFYGWQRRLKARSLCSVQAGRDARTVRIYWKNLFGEDDFRRNPEGEGLNPALNYGYAVLRAMVARALCASGLHPSLGVHHHNRYDAFCLADGLMEPFRPVVDRAVAKLKDEREPNPPLDRESKRALLEALLARFEADGESRTLFDWAGRTAASLAAAIESGEKRLEIPSL
jgi:CRISPR-associated protein Cas1